MEILNSKMVGNSFEHGAASHDQIKVVQFGTGVLLRGLVDYIFQKAIYQGLYHGSIAMVKSTSSDVSVFKVQDNLYTVVETGLDQNMQPVVAKTIISCIKEVWSAELDWDALKALFCSASLEVVVSNTTEVGLAYDADGNSQKIPTSFPGKLARLLNARYLAGLEDSSLVIIPTELIVGNGELLHQLVVRHSEAMGFGESFLSWLESSCSFCDSLVDRIVPGAFKADPNHETLSLSYVDYLAIQTEPYHLWAIQGGERLKSAFPFYTSMQGLVITEDINAFREQKLRLLNGTHTIMASMAFGHGCHTVEDMMHDARLRTFMDNVCEEEILPTLLSIAPDAGAFYQQMKSRWANPFIRHEWKSILTQTTTKMQARNGETIMRYYTQFLKLPPLLTFGFAYYLYLFRPNAYRGGKYYAVHHSDLEFEIIDQKAPALYNHWVPYFAGSGISVGATIKAILQDKQLFDHAFIELPGFIDQVQNMYQEIIMNSLDILLPKILESTKSERTIAS